MKKLVLAVGLLIVSGFSAPAVWAASAGAIDADADVALKQLYEEVKGSRDLVHDAKGVLIFPSVIKAGIGIGGEYGEGVLRASWFQKEYYSTAAASIGFQLGAQKKSIVVLFMQDDALKKFRNSSGWKAGVDASIAVVTVGAGGEMDTAKYKEPILGFIFGQKGLMYNLSLEGAKFTKLKK